MNQDLSRLHDIALPEPVSWMPQTIGWLVLLGLMVVLGAWLTFTMYRRHKANRYRRLALLELAQIAAAFDERDMRAKSLVQSRTLITLPSVLDCRDTFAAGLGRRWGSSRIERSTGFAR